MNVEWIPCEEQMPNTSRYVWVGILGELLGIQKSVQGVWVWGFACGDTHIPPTLWAEIPWPEPPEEAADVSTTD